MIRSMFSRTALIAGALAFAALPALAQSMQPSAPTPAVGAGANASVSTPAAKAKVDAKAGVKTTKTVQKPGVQKPGAKVAQKPAAKPQPVKAPAASGTPAVKSSTSTNGNASVSH